MGNHMLEVEPTGQRFESGGNWQGAYRFVAIGVIPYLVMIILDHTITRSGGG